MLLYFLSSLIIPFIYTYMKTKKSIHMLQQNWYDDDHRYLKWILNHKDKVFLSLDFCYVLLLPFTIINPYLGITLFSIFYIITILLFRKQKKREQMKLNLSMTKRVKRLFITTCILYIIPIIWMCLFFKSYLILYDYLIIGIMIYFNYFIVMVANIVNIPIEKRINHHFKKLAIQKLKNMNHLRVVGITGSYGKTSSKNILADILNIKLNAFATPKNFNTPLGLMLSINNYLDKFNDVFIAEMGAFKIGEIKELCDFVHPKYGIVTTIGTAHLESFGSQENIQKGKFELIESLPKDGVGILNGDDPYQISYHIQNNCKIIFIGIENKDVDVRAVDIKLTSNGTSFNCIFKGDKKKYHFETKLLGKANIYNILASIALSREFKIGIDQIILGVSKVRPIEHRLEMKKIGDIHILDDAYNSNPVGSKMALEVLNMMSGKKIIVTPGMIELGDKQYELNMKFGEYIADVCDEVILVGEEQTKPIVDGLNQKGYEKNHIHIINDVMIAFKMIQDLKHGETYVLLENDLPDIFNEKNK